jgi:hypothetical protein
MYSKEPDYKEVSKLRGINIAYENDLYDLAKLVLNVMDAIDKMSGKDNTASRPTINGLAGEYSSISGHKISAKLVIMDFHSDI